uniref:hypothetical protein n=1 Tax=Faecalibacterium sp. TaxID=1971605 RepID=UPI003FEFAC05
MDALTSLNTRRAESFHPFSKKFEKKKKKEKTDGSLTVVDNPLTNRLKLTILQIEKVLTSNVWSASRF